MQKTTWMIMGASVGLSCVLYAANLELQEGWNLAGIGSEDGNVSAAAFVDSCAQKLWRYDDGAWSSDELTGEDYIVLSPMQGFWVNSDGECTVDLSVLPEDLDGESTSTTVACEGETEIENTVCVVEEFLETLSDSEQSEVLLEWSDSTARTVWSNLPGVNRNGLRFGDMDEETLAAAKKVAEAVLSSDGYEDFLGVLAADDYLGTLRGNGGGSGGGSTYSSDNYYIAFFGTPDKSGNWMVQIGGHHLAYNVTYLDGVGYPVPNHIGVEPKSSFSINSASYAPLKEEGDVLVAMFDALDETQLSDAFLDGEVYSDVLIGPDNGSGVLPTDYPTSNRGLLVSSLSTAQKELVIAALEQWVGDYSSEVAQALLADYTSDEAFSETYIAWAGTETSGVDVDVSGTYMRIDGPRAWVEVACQSGVVVSNQTHYHTMFRDKSMDYGNSL